MQDSRSQDKLGATLANNVHCGKKLVRLEYFLFLIVTSACKFALAARYHLFKFQVSSCFFKICCSLPLLNDFRHKVTLSPLEVHNAIECYLSNNPIYPIFLGVFSPSELRAQLERTNYRHGNWNNDARHGKSHFVHGLPSQILPFAGACSGKTTNQAL